MNPEKDWTKYYFDILYEKKKNPIKHITSVRGVYGISSTPLLEAYLLVTALATGLSSMPECPGIHANLIENARILAAKETKIRILYKEVVDIV